MKTNAIFDVTASHQSLSYASTPNQNAALSMPLWQYWLWSKSCIRRCVCVYMCVSILSYYCSKKGKNVPLLTCCNKTFWIVHVRTAPGGCCGLRAICRRAAGANRQSYAHPCAQVIWLKNCTVVHTDCRAFWGPIRNTYYGFIAIIVAFNSYHFIIWQIHLQFFFPTFTVVLQ